MHIARNTNTVHDNPLGGCLALQRARNGRIQPEDFINDAI